jgi:hypothetical protein
LGIRGKIRVCRVASGERSKFTENGNSVGYRFPVFLPDGNHFLYQVGSEKPESAGVFVGSLDGSAGVRLLPGVTNALYAPPLAPGAPAHLLFRREDTLMAQPFDAPRLKTAGDMFPIAEQVPFSGNTGFGAFSVSENGILVYRSGASVSDRELIWMDRAGKHLGAFGKPGAFGPMAVSPDDKTLAVTVRNSTSATIARRNDAVVRRGFALRSWNKASCFRRNRFSAIRATREVRNNRMNVSNSVFYKSLRAFLLLGPNFCGPQGSISQSTPPHSPSGSPSAD